MNSSDRTSYYPIQELGLGARQHRESGWDPTGQKRERDPSDGYFADMGNSEFHSLTITLPVDASKLISKQMTVDGEIVFWSGGGLILLLWRGHQATCAKHHSADCA